MKYYVYIIYSSSTNTYYKGQTSNLDERLSRQNLGYKKSTKHGATGNWFVAWQNQQEERPCCLKRN